jgi:hypothetical protein
MAARCGERSSSAVNRDSQTFQSSREAMYAAGEPLLERAQASGDARPDLAFSDLLQLVIGVAGSTYADEGQRERVLALALDGVRAAR